MLIFAIAGLTQLASAASVDEAREAVMFTPTGAEGFVEEYRLAPAIRAGDYIFTSGVTAFLSDDTARTPEAFEASIRYAFNQMGIALNEAGADWSDVVEMTSFHVNMREHQDVFVRVREEFITQTPYPAWTAIGVERLWTDQLFLEIRVQAYLGDD